MGRKKMMGWMRVKGTEAMHRSDVVHGSEG